MSSELMQLLAVGPLDLSHGIYHPPAADTYLRWMQHCPPGRFLLLVVGGALLYLSAFSPLRAWLQRLAGVAPAAPANPGLNPGLNPGQNHGGGGGGAGGAANPNAGAGNAVAADGGQPGGGNANGRGGAADGGHIAPAGAPGGPAAAAAGGPARRGGVLRELQALLVGFFTSLLPGAGLTWSLFSKISVLYDGQPGSAEFAAVPLWPIFSL